MQAARGTSIDRGESDGQPVPGPTRPARRGRLAWLVVAVIGIAVDAVTKHLAVTHLDPDTPVPLIGTVLQLQLIRNSGAAFSIGGNFTIVFTVLAMVVLVFVVSRLVPKLGHRGWGVALGLLTAGVTGNLIDRIVRPPAVLRGHVIDFLQLPRWPIFNVADMCITSAAVLVVVLAIIQNVSIDGQRYPRPGRASTPGDRPGRSGSEHSESEHSESENGEAEHGESAKGEPEHGESEKGEPGTSGPSETPVLDAEPGQHPDGTPGRDDGRERE